MSIIRLSVLKDTPYAPNRRGEIEMLDYKRRRRVGRLEPLAAPHLAPARSDFRHYLGREVERAAADLPADQPVVVMVHGFLFDPKTAVSDNPKDTDNPHGRVYHFTVKDERHEQRHHTASWPVGLGFEEQDAGESGLAVAFGWQSQPGFATSLIEHFENFYARAYDNAGQSAWVLINLIHALAELMPGRRIDIFCHSLGSRVVLRALALAAKRPEDDEAEEDDDSKLLDPAVANDIIARIGRIVILGGAEYVVEAQLMRQRVDRLGLDDPPQVYNVVSRENDVLDKLAENFGPRTFGNSQVIGHNGLDIELDDDKRGVDHWIDLQIDRRALQDWMEDRHEITVSGDRPGTMWDHWYYYTHRGNMALYTNILRQRDEWAIPALRERGVPEGVPKPWWSFGD